MKKPPPSTARGAATAVLFRIERDGAWATPALDAEIDRARLDRRDAALATAIVYGALRTLPRLDAALDAHLRDPGGLDGWTRAALRVAAFQLLHLPRIPPRAIVHEAVDIVRSARGEHLSRLTNAVLRKVRRPDDAAPPERIETPQWIADALVGSLGEARAAQLTQPVQLPPPLDLRLIGEPAEGAAPYLERLAAAEPEAEVEQIGERSLRMRGVGDPRRLPGYDSGEFIVQELGSQRAVDALGAVAGERIADTCAGRGGKSLALLERVGPTGAVVALELHEARLQQLQDRRERLGLPGHLETVAVDLRVGTGGFDASFDRVLVDSPCTGLGTLGRRPELLWRLAPGDVAKLGKTQRAVLETASALVRPGGMLQYVVCSPLSDEGADIAAAFEAHHPDLRRDPPDHADADGVLRLGPWNDGQPTDAYQVVRWRRADR